MIDDKLVDLIYEKIMRENMNLRDSIVYIFELKASVNSARSTLDVN